ncbi:unnamed protein product [Pleuronectes platessa]|uniref:Uncharacterized protein n=1 Tax=Pleuronectes platessa TaxID=8262 RepID=A0A9N7ZC69_PLEPL|nr:unnamed protein product [Pleuronectes platessa]
MLRRETLGRAGYTSEICSGYIPPPPIGPLVKALKTSRSQLFCDSLTNFWLSFLLQLCLSSQPETPVMQRESTGRQTGTWWIQEAETGEGIYIVSKRQAAQRFTQERKLIPKTVWYKHKPKLNTSLQMLEEL